MIPLLLKAHYAHDAFYSGIRTVFTIHNLLYQGVFPHQLFSEILELDDRYFTMEGAEYYGNVNFLKAGIVYSDHVTTVSPTYAREVQTSHYGYGLDGLLSSLGDRFSGIVNGIDTKSYNPATDNKIAVKYRSSLSKKSKIKLNCKRIGTSGTCRCTSDSHGNKAR